mmetsp:Transcript_6131/g.13354  ORF Transcript_6131/g.13354 Transcript_6131/m.13354 type:complete len:461 (-) Transcript_6131:98-1480(-)
MKYTCFLACAAVLPMGSAFAPSPRTTSSRSQRTDAKMMVPNGMEELHNLHHLSTMIIPDQHFLAQTSTWIADSSAAVVDAVDVAADAASDVAATAVSTADETSWWESYIQLYKNGLAFVHDNIVDEPLRKAGFTQTWGVSIFLFTAAVRACLIPFSISQNRSSEYMKALKPYQKKIKEKYADENMQNKAIGKLYEDAEQNPLAGCITSFAQIPIFLGLYRSVTRLAAEGRLDEPFLWIPTLQGPVSAENNYRGMQWLTENWVDGVPSMGWEGTIPFLIMPVVLVLMQSFTMSVLQPPVDDSQSEEEQEQMQSTQKILKFLPLMIGFFSLQVPAGLTIYWFTSNLFTVSQSLIIRGYYAANPPQITLPDYWDALDKGDEMTADEKREAAMAGLSTGPTFGELLDEANFHYIVKRDPLRADSEAWARVESSGGRSVPEEMKSWVGSAANAEVAASETASVAQ